MSDAKQRCFELVQAAGEQQRSIAAVLCAAELWAAQVDMMPPIRARYADLLVEIFAEFRAASDRWRDTMRWIIGERWAGTFDLRAATELDGVFSDICMASRDRILEGSLSEGVVLQLDLIHASHASCLHDVARCVAQHDAGVEPNVNLSVALVTVAVMKAWRAVHDAYRDLARCEHESCLLVGLSAEEPTIDAAALAGSYTIARWMDALEQARFSLCERDAVLGERERAYAAPGYAHGAEAGRIRSASIAAFRARTGTYSPVRDETNPFRPVW